jgi:hypothetical protein
MKVATVALVFVAFAAGVPVARAEAVDKPSSGNDAAATSRCRPIGRTFARFFDPQDGQLDLSSFLEDPRGFLPIPLIVTEPAVGYGGGVIGMFLRPRKEVGEEGWARPDISAVGGLATQNGTWAALAGDSSRWFDGRLKTLIGAGTGIVNLDFYGLGDPASFNQGVRYSLNFSGAIAQANWQLAPKSPWSIGLR